MMSSKLNFVLRLLFSLVFFVVGFQQVSAQNSPPKQIHLNAPIEGGITAGKTVSFALHLESNQFAVVSVEQKGVNLVLAIDDTDEKRQLEIDVNFSDFGYDRALIESGDAPRDLLIRVFPQLPEKTPNAKFSVALVELKTKDDRDKQRIASQKALLDALRLLKEDKKESKLQGFFLLSTALKLARDSSDRILEATALIFFERVYFELGDYNKSIESAEQALALTDTPDKSYYQLLIKDQMTPALNALNQLKRSIEVSSDVLKKAQLLNDRRLVMSSLSNLSWANLRLNDLSKTIEYAEQAYETAKEIGSINDRINSLRIIGITYYQRNDFNKAIEVLNQALLDLKDLKDNRQLHGTYSDLANNYLSLGQYQKAIDYFQLALETLRQREISKDWEQGILSNIAYCYEMLGQNARALDYNRQSLEIASKFDYKTGIIEGLWTKGRIYLALKDYENARAAYSQALQLALQGENQAIAANMYFSLSNAEIKLGRPEIALEYQLKGLEIRKSLKIDGGENKLANLYLILENPEKSAEYAKTALEKSRAVGDRVTESEMLYALARARRAQKNPAAALPLIQDSLKIVESIRSELINQEIRTSYLSTVRDKYDFYISLLIEMQNQPENKKFGALAFAASERARARGLLDLLAESQTDVFADLSPVLKGRERGIEAKIAALQTQLIKLKSEEKQDEPRIASLQNDIKQADGEREKLQTEIRRASPRYAALKYPTTLDLAQTQMMLDDKTVLLEYQTGAKDSFLFAVSKNDFQIFKLPDEKTLRRAVEALRSSVSVPTRTGLANYLVAGRELYATLLGPIENLLASKTKIIVAADGALHYLPFEVLLRNNANTNLDKLPYLVRDFDISYTPSASVLANLKKDKNAAQPSKSFLAFAAPDYTVEADNQKVAGETTRSVLDGRGSWKLTELKNSKIEAEKIAAIFPVGQSTVFTGSQATEERAKTNDLLSQYRYLHFAVHGLIDEEHPQFSSLVLSLPKANPKSQIRDDGLLQTPEIFNLRLRADLVTLSACDTGLGQEMRGEGIVGLTRAFFYAGTPSVLVSLWNVDDASTAELMANFYEQLAQNGGRDKAAALRQAQLKLISGNRYAHPYYWAPFILQGRTTSTLAEKQ